MRLSVFRLAVVIALVSAAGCSGGGASSAPVVPPRPGVLSTMRMLSDASMPNAVWPKGALFVSDFGTGAVEVLNASHKLAFSLTSGLSQPNGNWTDKAGTLFVADSALADVVEFANGARAPKFTYSGMNEPAAVTTDAAGNVYVADNNAGNPGFIYEFAHDNNTIVKQWNVGASPNGVAIDGKGNIFVTYLNFTTGASGIVEFKNGSTTGTQLPLTFGRAGGITIGSSNELIVCDRNNAVVDIIPSPYTTISHQITGAFTKPFRSTLNKAGTILYIADNLSNVVALVKYPSGTAITTLGSAQGLSSPSGVAAFPSGDK